MRQHLHFLVTRHDNAPTWLVAKYADTADGTIGSQYAGTYYLPVLPTVYPVPGGFPVALMPLFGFYPILSLSTTAPAASAMRSIASK